MTYHLICVHPFGVYAKGQKITDPEEVAKLMDDRDHHFVRVLVPPPVDLPPTVEPPPAPPKSK